MHPLIFIRHGESMGNVWPEIYTQDRLNFLSLKGVKQAEIAGIELRIMMNQLKLEFAHVVTSGMTRALHTGTTIMQTMGDWKRHYEVDERLNEWKEDWHGLLGEEKAETSYDHFQRVKAAYYETILPKCQDGPVLVVSHYYTMQAIYNEMTGSRKVPHFYNAQPWIRVKPEGEPTKFTMEPLHNVFKFPNL